MGKFLKRQTKTIFIMLGNGCNLSCIYCLQHPLVHKPLSNKINPDIYEFIKECNEENGKDHPVHLQFFGGEPLVYYPNIEEIVEATKDIGCTYSIITNGKLMNDHMVEFFNKNNFWVTISWDGPNVMKTRGFDAFDPSSPLRRRLLRLDHLSISAVMSSKAYPKEILEGMQEISNQYYKLKGYQVGINIDQIFDTGITNKEILDVDYQRVRNEIEEMGKEFLLDTINSKYSRESYTKTTFIQDLYNHINQFYGKQNGIWNKYYCNCGNGYAILNMDLEGNLYTCHNTSTKVGTIYTPYFQYLNELLKTDYTDHMRSTCKDCIALAFCNGGCKLVSEQAREETYCKLKKAVFEPMLNLIQEYGKMVGESKNA